MNRRIASATAFAPSIAFGLKAVALAMKAKCGRLAKDEADTLVACCRELLPDDAVALVACEGFVACAALDQPTAGRALHDFILARGGEVARIVDRTDAVLTDHARIGPDFDWQSRKDCGHG